MNKFVITLLLVLSGCATQNINHNYTSQYSDNTLELSETGTIVGSIARDPNTHRYHYQSFYFENVETNEKYKVNLSPADGASNKTKLTRFDHFSTLEGTGDVFKFTLPKGKYHFYNFYLKHENKSWTAKDDYSIPFDVTADEVKYIGQIKQVPLFGGKFLGLNVRDYAGSIWVLSDQAKRDKKFIKEIYPNVNLEGMVVAVPDFEKVPSDIIITPSEAEDFSYSVDSFTDGVIDTFSVGDFVCGEPFNVKLNCTRLLGASKKIQINDAKMKISGSEDGRRVLVMKPNFFTLTFTSAEKTLNEIKKVLSNNSIKVTSVKALKFSNNMEGYIVDLDGDGYSILKGFSIKK